MNNIRITGQQKLNRLDKISCLSDIPKTLICSDFMISMKKIKQAYRIPRKIKKELKKGVTNKKWKFDTRWWLEHLGWIKIDYGRIFVDKIRRGNL